MATNEKQDSGNPLEPVALGPQPTRLPGGEGESSGDGGLMDLSNALLTELREQRSESRRERELAYQERRSSLRWKRIMQLLLFGTPLLLGVLYFALFLSTTGLKLGPWRDVVGVVRIEGPIMAGKPASAEKVNEALEKAFSSNSVKAVVLSIDSPGGSPSEAERIYRAVDSLRKKHPKPVLAVIDSVGASAAYLIAIHADQIVAGKYSLVGSIGALMEGWQLDRALAKVDVTQRLYTSGKLKGFMNPFTASSPEADAKANQVVRLVGSTFLSEVKTARGTNLKTNVDYGTGEIWVGEEAKQIGLVDSIGTIDDLIETTWGLKTFNFGPDKAPLNLFAESVGAVVENAVERLLSQSRPILQ